MSPLEVAAGKTNRGTDKELGQENPGIRTGTRARPDQQRGPGARPVYGHRGYEPFLEHRGSTSRPCPPAGGTRRAEAYSPSRGARARTRVDRGHAGPGSGGRGRHRRFVRGPRRNRWHPHLPSGRGAGGTTLTPPPGVVSTGTEPGLHDRQPGRGAHSDGVPGQTAAPSLGGGASAGAEHAAGGPPSARPVPPPPGLRTPSSGGQPARPAAVPESAGAHAGTPSPGQREAARLGSQVPQARAATSASPAPSSTGAPVPTRSHAPTGAPPSTGAPAPAPASPAVPASAPSQSGRPGVSPAPARPRPGQPRPGQPGPAQRACPGHASARRAHPGRTRTRDAERRGPHPGRTSARGAERRHPHAGRTSTRSTCTRSTYTRSTRTGGARPGPNGREPRRRVAHDWQTDTAAARFPGPTVASDGQTDPASGAWPGRAALTNGAGHVVDRVKAMVRAGAGLAAATAATGQGNTPPEGPGNAGGRYGDRPGQGRPSAPGSNPGSSRGGPPGAGGPRPGMGSGPGSRTGAPGGPGARPGMGGRPGAPRTGPLSRGGPDATYRAPTSPSPYRGGPGGGGLPPRGGGRPGTGGSWRRPRWSRRWGTSGR